MRQADAAIAGPAMKAAAVSGLGGGVRRGLLLLALACAGAMATSVKAEPVGGAGATSSPCVAATPACTEWVGLGPRGARAMVYRTFPLDAPNPSVRRALIMIHGALRNADRYFSTATGSAFLAGALSDTIVIAPAFHSSSGECKDQLAVNEVSWSCTGDAWKSGGQAVSDPQLTSFDFIDTILRRLADRRLFPNLAVIVVAGHSAGGQFVTRYEMANRVHEGLGVPVAYVVANPSSYAWPVPSRPLAKAAAGEWRRETPDSEYSFGPFVASKAPAFDRWPYGLEGRTSGYTVGLSDDQLKRQLSGRPTTYLLGQVDVLPLGGFDDSPSAMAQGPTRRARGEAFVKFINERLGANARMMIVPECGHNDRCIFTTDAVLPVLFPAPN